MEFYSVHYTLPFGISIKSNNFLVNTIISNININYLYEFIELHIKGCEDFEAMISLTEVKTFNAPPILEERQRNYNTKFRTINIRNFLKFV